MDQFLAMRAFIRVVETGNFTRAASALSLPKASVTNLINGLESHLRTKLLNRTTRRVAITTDGALYYERALTIVRDLEELDGNISKSQTLPVGDLRFDMASEFASSVVGPALIDFFERYPKIRIDLRVNDGHVDYLGENIDCSLRIGTPTDQSLIVKRIGELDLVTCAASNYIEAYGLPQRPEDLASDHRLIGNSRFEAGLNASLAFTRGAREVQVRPIYALSINDSRTYLAALLAGLGAGQIPRFMVADAIDRGALMRVLPEWSINALPVFIVYPPNRHLSNKVRVFVDWLVEHMAFNKLNAC